MRRRLAAVAALLLAAGLAWIRLLPLACRRCPTSRRRARRHDRRTPAAPPAGTAARAARSTRGSQPIPTTSPAASRRTSASTRRSTIATGAGGRGSTSATSTATPGCAPAIRCATARPATPSSTASAATGWRWHRSVSPFRTRGSLHVAAIAALHRVVTRFDPDVPLPASAYYLVPVLAGALRHAAGVRHRPAPRRHPGRLHRRGSSAASIRSC
ncbi:MAG: hypothetical protein U0802_13985 [Candidatus Binatia bacterium]